MKWWYLTGALCIAPACATAPAPAPAAPVAAVPAGPDYAKMPFTEEFQPMKAPPAPATLPVLYAPGTVALGFSEAPPAEPQAPAAGSARRRSAGNLVARSGQ